MCACCLESIYDVQGSHVFDYRHVRGVRLLYSCLPSFLPLFSSAFGWFGSFFSFTLVRVFVLSGLFFLFFLWLSRGPGSLAILFRSYTPIGSHGTMDW